MTGTQRQKILDFNRTPVFYLCGYGISTGIIVQCSLEELDIAKFLASKSSASVDQLVERLTSDPKVPGSIPRRGS